MRIEENCIVSIHYELKDESGSVLDSTVDKGPVVYLHGSHHVIPGLERALSGKSAGDCFQVTLPPEEAYGKVKAELIQILPRSMFEGVPNLQPGMQLQAQNPNGQPQLITVQEINEAGVTIDNNHPLAGLVLQFEVRVEEVRKATEQEIALSQAH